MTSDFLIGIKIILFKILFKIYTFPMNSKYHRTQKLFSVSNNTRILVGDYEYVLFCFPSDLLGRYYI